MAHLGDFDAAAVIYGKFTTYRPSTGASFTLGGTPALSVYKDNSTTQSTTGVTLTADFDSVTGLNHFAIDTSADGSFYAAGSFFDIVITTGTVDGVSVVGSVVASFTIRKNSALKPTTAGRTLDVSAGGEAGLDWANVGSPTTSLNLSGTTISTSQAVASVSGAVGSVTGSVGGSVASVTGNVGGNVAGSIGSVATGGIVAASFAAGAIDAAAIATDAITSAELAATATAEIATAVRTELATELARIDVATSTRLAAASYTAPLDAAGTRSAVGLASANLDTQLTAIDDYLDTEVAAIKAKTDNLPSDPADASDIAASFSTVNSTLSTIAGYIDTEVAAILAAVDTPSAATIAAAVWSESTRTLTAIDEDSTTLDLDATIRAAVGLASADLDTQLGDIATDAAAADIRGERTVCRGTVTTGASTTSIPTSALTPAGAAADQFKGRIIIFDIDTATAALRGQATDITASSNSSTPTFTVTALTSTPASGDTFTIV